MKKNLLIYSAGFLGLLLLIGLWYGLFMYWRVNNVVVSGTKNLQGVEDLAQKPLILINLQTLEKRLYDANPTVSSLHIAKLYPSTIQIQVIMGQQLGILHVDKGYFILSKNGRILKKIANTQDRPIITFYQPLHFSEYEPGDRVNFIDIESALYFLDKFSYLGIQIDTVDITSLDMIVCKQGNKEYVFTTRKDKNAQYQDLKLLLEQFMKDNHDYHRIDLRFDKPIVGV